MESSNLTKAKSLLICDQPFFASLLFSLPLKVDESIPTLATDGTEILYNPEFIKSLTLAETIFVLGHEVLHCVFQHMTRRGSRDPQKWNIAADYVINDLLIAEKVGLPVKGALINSALVASGGGTTEGVYNLLPDSPPQNQKQKQNQNQNGPSQNGPGHPTAGQPGGPLDEVRDAAGDESGLAKADAETRVKIVQAANAAKMAGKLSAGLARIVKEATKTKVDWKSVLRRFLSERAKTDFSFAKPKRRFLADDLNLPSLVGEKLGTVVIAVDCSGSIGPEILAEFSAEIKGIIEDTSPAMTHVIYFDSEVSSAEAFGPDDTFKINATGGGGTAFSPIFSYIEENQLDPAATVVLTDLCCSDFGPAPAYPVLWASNYDDYAPFGEILKLN